MVGEGVGVLKEFGAERSEAGGQPGLGADGDLRAASGDGAVDAIGCVARGYGNAWSSGGEVEPAALGVRVAPEVGVGLPAGAHQARADGGDANAFVAKLGVQPFREADHGELGGGVGKHVGNGDLAADAGDVDDGGAAAAGRIALQGLLAAHMGQRCPGDIERGEEVHPHGVFEDLQRLGFERADVDDAGVVDEDVDAAEAGDGLCDQALALLRPGQIGSDEVKVPGAEMGKAGEEVRLGLLQFFEVAGGEHQADGVLGEASRDGQAQASGASGDNDDGADAAAVRCSGPVPAGAQGADDQHGSSGGGDGGGHGGDCGAGDRDGGGGGEGGEAEAAHMWII